MDWSAIGVGTDQKWNEIVVDRVQKRVGSGLEWNWKKYQFHDVQYSISLQIVNKIQG